MPWWFAIGPRADRASRPGGLHLVVVGPHAMAWGFPCDVVEGADQSAAAALHTVVRPDQDNGFVAVGRVDTGGAEAQAGGGIEREALAA